MVVHRCHVALDENLGAQIGPGPRYELLNQIRRACDRRGVQWLAFGFDEGGLRLVLQGSEALVDGVRSALDRHLPYGPGEVVEVADAPSSEAQLVAEAVVWAHRGPIERDGLAGALASPWSSHRDLLGYRVAPFFDRKVVVGQVCQHAIHKACGGGQPPTRCRGRLALVRRRGRPADRRAPREDLLRLSRLAASVIGRVPADPRCFSLFAQLARARGWSPPEIAGALLVSTRRVRQLCEDQVRELGLALTALSHPETLGRLP